jgi:iron complex transport system permease protein
MTGVGARLARTLLLFGGFLLVTTTVAPLVGSTAISLVRVFDGSVPFVDNVDAQIFFIARMPRVLAAVVVGGSLAAAGVVLQALFRNPLAAPETLGVSAGAALGAILAITAGSGLAVGPFSPVPLASLAGALGAATLVYLLASAPRRPLSRCCSSPA